MEAGESFCWRPYNWIALSENHCAALLNMLVREKRVQAVRTGPQIHDQELAGTFGFGVSIMFHWDVDHMADISKGFCSGNTIRITSSVIVNFARRFQGSGRERAADGKQIQGILFGH